LRSFLFFVGLFQSSSLRKNIPHYESVTFLFIPMKMDIHSAFYNGNRNINMAALFKKTLSS
jgi:hypothetical protein